MLRISGRPTFEVSRDELKDAMRRPDEREVSKMRHIHSASDAIEVYREAAADLKLRPGEICEVECCHMGQERRERKLLPNGEKLSIRLRGDAGMTRLQAVAKEIPLEKVILLGYDTRVSPNGYTIDSSDKFWRKDFDTDIIYATTGCSKEDAQLHEVHLSGNATIVSLVASCVEAVSKEFNTALDAKWEHIKLRCYRYVCIELMNLLKNLTKTNEAEYCEIRTKCLSEVGCMHTRKLQGLSKIHPISEQTSETINVRRQALYMLTCVLDAAVRFWDRASRGFGLEVEHIAHRVEQFLRVEEIGIKQMLLLTVDFSLHRACFIDEVLCLALYIAETELMEPWYKESDNGVVSYKGANRTRSVALDALERLDIETTVLCKRKKGYLFEDESIGLEIDFYEEESSISIEPVHNAYDARSLRKLDHTVTASWGTIRPYENGTFLTQAPGREIDFKDRDGEKMRAMCAAGEMLIFRNNAKARVMKALRSVQSVGIGQVVVTLSDQLGDSFLAGSAAFNAALKGDYRGRVAFWVLAKCHAGDIKVNRASTFTCFLPSTCLSSSARTYCNTTLSRELMASAVYAMRKRGDGRVELYWLPMESGKAFRVRPGTSLTQMVEDNTHLDSRYKLCRWFPRSRIGDR